MTPRRPFCSRTVEDVYNFKKALKHLPHAEHSVVCYVWWYHFILICLTSYSKASCGHMPSFHFHGVLLEMYHFILICLATKCFVSCSTCLSSTFAAPYFFYGLSSFSFFSILIHKNHLLIKEEGPKGIIITISLQKN